MRKLLSVMVAGLLVATLGACNEQPTQVQRSGTDAAADHSDDAAPRSEGTFSKPTWAGDELWIFQRNQPILNQGQGNNKLVFLTPSDDIAQRPFYVIGESAGDDGAQSNLFFVDDQDPPEGHDHVTPAPPKSAGEFKATVQLLVVVPGPNGTVGQNIKADEAFDFFSAPANPSARTAFKLVYAADVDGSGTIDPDEDFTNVDVVQKAAEQGLVKLGTTFEETVLTLRPKNN